MVISFPLVVLFLNGLRNYKIYSVFKTTGFNGGEVLYGGNNFNLDGSHHIFRINKALFIPQNKLNGYNVFTLGCLPTLVAMAFG